MNRKNFVIILMLAIALAGCSEAALMMDEEDGAEPQTIRTGYEDADEVDFCDCLNIEDIGETIPVINEFLSGLSSDLTEEQKLQELVTWLKSYPCTVDASVSCYQCDYQYHLKNHEVTVSFDKNGNKGNFTLDIMSDLPLVVIGHYTDEHEFFYGEWYGNKEHPIARKDKIVIQFLPDADTEVLFDIINGDGSLRPTENVYFGRDPNVLLDGKPALVRAAVLESKNMGPVSAATIESLLAKPEVVSVSYEYRFVRMPVLSTKFMRVAFSDKFIVKLKETTSYSQLQQLAEQNNCIVVTESEKNRYVLSVSKTSNLDVMKTANLFFETGLFVSSTPDIFLIEAIRTYEVFDPEVHEHDFCYDENGKKTYFVFHKRSVIIKTQSEVDAIALCKQDILRNAHAVSSNFVTANIDPTTKLYDLLQLPGVVDASYGLRQANDPMGYIDVDLTNYLYDKIWVRTKEKQSIEEILDYAGIGEGVVNVELFDKWNNIYLITISVKMGEIFGLCRNLFETGLCIYAGPSYIGKGHFF